MEELTSYSLYERLNIRGESMNVQEIRDALAKNQIVGLKSSNGYKIYPEEAHRDYHRAHFTFDPESNTVLSLRCTSNYFGSLLHESEMNELEVKA